ERGGSRRGDPARCHVGAERLHAAGPDSERYAHRSRLAIVLDLIVVEAAVDRDRTSPSPPPALPAGALECDYALSVAAYAGTGGEAQPDRAVGRGGDSGREALGARGPRDERPHEHWPARKSAFYRISTGSRSLSAMSISQRPLSAPHIWESEKITFSFKSSPVTFAYRPRKKAAFSGERCWPSQKIAFSRASSEARSL